MILKIKKWRCINNLMDKRTFISSFGLNKKNEKTRERGRD